MEHVLDTNRRTALIFVKKARSFLGLPKGFFECDIKQCNPSLYTGAKGKAQIQRARKGLVLLVEADKALAKLSRLLEGRRKHGQRKQCAAKCRSCKCS